MTKTVLIKPKMADSGASYWSMFYCAILKTIVYQKNLQFRFDNPSLQSYRGTLKHPANFFNQMKANINNHGFEYLMIDYIRSKDGVEARNSLVSGLLQQYGIHDFEYKFLNVFKLGDDSSLHEEILKFDDPDIKVLAPIRQQTFRRGKVHLAGQTRPISNVAESFLHSDLLIMVSDGRNHTYGFVGEVEGHHGENLFRDSYWTSNNGIKGLYTSFALGASDRKKSIDDITIKENIVLTSDNEGRKILHFSNSNPFMKSFRLAINNIDLCLAGHFSNIGGLDESHQKIINIIKDDWGNNVQKLISTLEKLIDYDVNIEEFSYQSDDGNNGTIYKPSPLVLQNSFYLHRLNEIE